MEKCAEMVWKAHEAKLERDRYGKREPRWHLYDRLREDYLTAATFFAMHERQKP